MGRVCHQVNLQTSLGGGEVYTRFLCAALATLGWESRLYVSPLASFWRALGLANTQLVPVEREAELETSVPGEGEVLLTHTALSPNAARRLAKRHRLGGIIHMPLYERDPAGLRGYRRVFGVSRHVIESARSRGYMNVDPRPLYGIADLDSRGTAEGGPLRAASVYDWDKRKLRDRFLGFVEPWIEPFVRRPAFHRSRELTLGIVSRLTPIKQFPMLFSILASRIAAVPGVRLEIFGAGGYATVRDLRRELRPLGSRVRLWGHQPDVAAVYPQLDWVLSGLPEKEALGLNLIEAQACGTPVLAVNAPPFTETVEPGRTGYLFSDPRTDGGSDFSRLLGGLRSGETTRPDPRLAVEHLHRFSHAEFVPRIRDALMSLMAT